MKTQNLKSVEKLMASKKAVILCAKEQTKVTGGVVSSCNAGYCPPAGGSSSAEVTGSAGANNSGSAKSTGSTTCAASTGVCTACN